MLRKLRWGIVALTILLIAGVFIYWQVSSVQQLERELAEDDELLDHFDPDGVFHGRHAEDPATVEVPQQETQEVSAEPPSVEVPKKEKQEAPKTPPKKLYTGPLTFHAELLKTNPVKALRLQQEERGHWSAAWIPPFPPDDTEAQEFARVEYLWRYYIQTYGYEKLGTPEYAKEAKAYREADAMSSQMYSSIRSYPYGARKMDLMKLTWPSLSEAPRSTHYSGHPSEYFGDAKTRERLKQLGMWDY